MSCKRQRRHASFNEEYGFVFLYTYSVYKMNIVVPKIIKQAMGKRPIEICLTSSIR